jgi:hydrogenase maturation protease
VTGRMLIAGVGNIFLGDDGFGVEVATRLADVTLPEWVTVADYGISGMHLAYDLAEGYETTILVDATPRGSEPGTVYVMELDAGKNAGKDAGAGSGTDASAGSGTDSGADAGSGANAGSGADGGSGADAGAHLAAAALEASRGIPLLDGHGMQPDLVFGMLNLLGADAGRVLLVGCEPASIDERIGLSAPVTAAVDEAVRIVLDLVHAAAEDRPAAANSQPGRRG